MWARRVRKYEDNKGKFCKMVGCTSLARIKGMCRHCYDEMLKSDIMLFKCIDCGKRNRLNERLIKKTFGKEGCCTLYRCRDCWTKIEKRPSKKDMSHYNKIKELAQLYKQKTGAK